MSSPMFIFEREFNDQKHTYTDMDLVRRSEFKAKCAAFSSWKNVHNPMCRDKEYMNLVRGSEFHGKCWVLETANLMDLLQNMLDECAPTVDNSEVGVVVAAGDPTPGGPAEH